MNIKGNIKYIVAGSIVFLIIYLFAAPLPLKSELYFEPVWTQDISEAKSWPEGLDAPLDLEPFILGEKFGYFTPSGEILFSRQMEGNASVSRAAWAHSDMKSKTTSIASPDGTPAATIALQGNVFLMDDRRYLFLPGGGGVSQLDETGKPLWTQDHIAPLTAFNSSRSGTIMGYGDGKLVCVNQTGEILFSFYPGGSSHQIILSAAVSEDGKKVVCLSGIKEQRILVIDIRANQTKIIQHRYLKGDLRRNSFASFESAGEWAFVETSDGLGIIDCKKNEIHLIPLGGKIVSAGFNPGESLFLILSRDEEYFTLAMVERPDHLLASTRFKADNAFLIQNGGDAYLGADSNISKIAIRGLK